MLNFLRRFNYELGKQMTAEDIAHQIIAELTRRGMTAETGKITDYGTEFLRNKIGYSFEYAFGKGRGSGGR